MSAAAGQYAQWLHSLNREDIPVRVFDFWVASDEFVEVSRATHLVLGVERWLGPIRFARVEGWLKRYDHLLEQNPADDPARRGDEFLDAEGVVVRLRRAAAAARRGSAERMAVVHLRGEQRAPRAASATGPVTTGATT